MSSYIMTTYLNEKSYFANKTIDYWYPPQESLPFLPDGL